MIRWYRTHRFDIVETGLIAVFAALCAGFYVWFPSPSPELSFLRSTYGPDHYSQHVEEWVIRDFFKDRREGTFVDVGASHYKTFSNTYYLETRLGWSGVAIDPQPQYEADYRRFRPRTRFLAAFAGSVSGDRVTLYVLDGLPLVASSERTFTEKWGDRPREVVVPTVTLDDVLAGLQIRLIDLLSIDVELSEPKVLAGFDVERHRPSFVCIEAHPEVRQAILNYFASHRYVVVGKYLRADSDNLYFVPLAQ